MVCYSLETPELGGLLLHQLPRARAHHLKVGLLFSPRVEVLLAVYAWRTSVVLDDVPKNLDGWVWTLKLDRQVVELGQLAIRAGEDLPDGPGTGLGRAFLGSALQREYEIVGSKLSQSPRPECQGTPPCR